MNRLHSVSVMCAPGKSGIDILSEIHHFFLDPRKISQAVTRRRQLNQPKPQATFSARSHCFVLFVPLQANDYLFKTPLAFYSAAWRLLADWSVGHAGVVFKIGHRLLHITLAEDSCAMCNRDPVKVEIQFLKRFPHANGVAVRNGYTGDIG